MGSKEKLLARIIRVNQAGEVGAQRIYNSQKKVFKFLGRHDDVEEISRMAKEEEEHLNYFNEKMRKHNVRPTALGPFWEIGASAIGLTTAIMGPKAAYTCTEAVEEVIVEHYQNQIDMLEGIDPELQGKIKRFQQDEEGHKQTAINRGSKEVFAYKALRQVLRKTTQAAVYFAERI